MGKLIYQEPQDFFVQISICSVNTFLDLNSFRIHINEDNLRKVDIVLNNSIGSFFILFPEYTYSEELQEKYQSYCNQNNCIIIGGSGIEGVGSDFYAYSPVFLPNQEPIKVYKKHITIEERVYSAGRIISYPNDVQRQIRIVGEENDILFSVYICYDFLLENKNERADIIFVPQYEKSPRQFINEGDRVSKGMKNFVLGANNSNEQQRSLGFAILNSSLISALTFKGWRHENYSDDQGEKLDYHHTVAYDTTGEKLIKFKINIGRPYSLPFTFSMSDNEPVLIPIEEILI